MNIKYNLMIVLNRGWIFGYGFKKDQPLGIAQPTAS